MSLVSHKANEIKAVKNHILIKGMEFSERITQAGLIIPTDNGKSEGIRPRWAEVVAVGPDQTDVAVGEWILIEHGRWTRGLKMLVDGEELVLRRVDPDSILLVSDKQHKDETWSTALSAQSDRHRIEGSMHRHDGREDF